MSYCKIMLDNYSGVYYAGSQIEGRVQCYFDEETTLRGIKVRVTCEESNSWGGTETYKDSDGNSKTRHITLTGQNTILHSDQLLFGSGSSSDVIPRGERLFKFHYKLPIEIPSTFNGPHGGIIYTVKAIVDRPLRFDYEDSHVFTVQAPIDFNYVHRDLQELSTYSDEKTVCCWCCTGGAVTMDVELSKSAFVAGESIPLKVSIINLSRSNVESLEVEFRKIVRYKVTSPHSESKEDTESIVKLHKHGVGAHGEYTYELELAIPSYVEVFNFNKCNLFIVNYILNINAVMPSCTLDLSLDISNIKMGHVQLSNDLSAINYNTTTPSAPPLMTNESYNTSNLKDYGGFKNPAELPPPSYDEVERLSSKR